MKKNYSSQAVGDLDRDGEAINRWKYVSDRNWSDDGTLLIASNSGHERNHIFFNSPETIFEDFSGISGLDSIKDSRVFSMLDFDRDGWLDLAVVNVNYPLLNVYRNRLAELHARNRIKRNVIAIRFVGGNHTSKPSTDYSSRDGFGAVVTLNSGDLSLTREHRCGDGMAAQNSCTMLIGIGDNQEVQNLKVTWPSGKSKPQQFENVKAGTLLTVYENPEQSPNKKKATFENYLKNIPVKGITAAIKPVSTRRLDFGEFGSVASNAKMRIFTSTFTTCKACKKRLPQLEAIKDYFEKFAKDEVALLGVPVDLEDLKNDSQELKKYMKEYEPSYKMMLNLSDSASKEFVALKFELLDNYDVDPATIITDSHGTIYYAEAGVPDISTLKKILAHIQSKQ